MTTKDADVQKLEKRLGRHSRLILPFTWRIDGSLVDLEDESYTARAWVTTPDGVTSGPFDCTIDGTEAQYTLREADLAQASIRSGDANVEVVVVAESGDSTLVSDVREVEVGDWSGAGDYEPS